MEDTERLVDERPAMPGHSFEGFYRDTRDPATGEIWLPDAWTVHDASHDTAALGGTWTVEGGWLVARPPVGSAHPFTATRYDPRTLLPEPAAG